MFTFFGVNVALMAPLPNHFKIRTLYWGREIRDYSGISQNEFVIFFDQSGSTAGIETRLCSGLASYTEESFSITYSKYFSVYVELLKPVGYRPSN
jgi:hypothetical protein